MIALLLQAGCTEDEICERLSMTHKTVRAICIAKGYQLDYSIVSQSLIDEIQSMDTSIMRDRRRLATRYRLTLDIILTIIYNTRAPHIYYPTKEELLQLGDSFTEIQEASNLTRYHVRRIIGKDHQFDPYQQDIIEAILNHERPVDIAKQYNKPVQVIYRLRDKLIVRPSRKKYVVVDPTKIIELHHQGCTQQEIAKLLNTTQPTVSRHLKDIS